MPEPTDPHRDAQIQAARAVLLRLAAEPESIHDQLAAELVDAVNAAGRDGQDDEDAHDECHARVMATREAAIKGFTEIRAALLAALDLEDDRYTTLVQYVAQLVEQRDQLRAEVDQQRQRADQGEARVWQQAIQALRDRQRYLNWVSHEVFRAEVSQSWQQHVADYLEAVGPGTVAAAFEAHAEEALAIAEQALTAQAEVHRLAGPFDEPPGGNCPDCRCAWAWHSRGRCSGDFLHCPCRATPPATPAETAADGTDGAGRDAGNGAEETGGNGTSTADRPR